MPTKHRLWLNKHRDEGCTAHPPAQRRHDRAIGRIELDPLDLTAHDTKLMSEKKQFRFRILDAQPDINQIEEQPHQGVDESKEHRRSKCYRSGNLTPGSLLADEYASSIYRRT